MKTIVVHFFKVKQYKIQAGIIYEVLGNVISIHSVYYIKS